MPAARNATHPHGPMLVACADAVAKPSTILAIAEITVPAALAPGSSIPARACPSPFAPSIAMLNAIACCLAASVVFFICLAMSSNTPFSPNLARAPPRSSTFSLRFSMCSLPCSSIIAQTLTKFSPISGFSRSALCHFAISFWNPSIVGPVFLLRPPPPRPDFLLGALPVTTMSEIDVMASLYWPVCALNPAQLPLDGFLIKLPLSSIFEPTLSGILTSKLAPPLRMF